MKKAIAVLACFFVLVGCGGKSEQEKRKDDVLFVTQRIARLTLVSALIRNENSIPVAGEFPTAIQHQILGVEKSITAPEVVVAFDENAVAAEKAMGTKPVLLYGRVESVERSIGGYSVFLRGPNRFNNFRANFEKEYAPELSQLRKGESVRFVCKSWNKYLLARADCQPIKSVVEESVPRINHLVEQIVKGGTSGYPNFDRFVNLSHELASHLPEKSECFKKDVNISECGKDLQKAADILDKEKKSPKESDVSSEKHEEKKPGNSAMNSTNNPLAMACYRQSMKLLTPNDQDSWVMKSQTVNDFTAEFVATRKGDTAIVNWFSGTGTQALQTCQVRKLSQNGEEVFSREETLSRNTPNPVFF